ncbi:aspartate 1-decarboxylase [Candidatus Woesearchaeota archaeon]|nr:aspartate 1-decarboxylase [Candidatus Woesearchaeota archaeon]
MQRIMLKSKIHGCTLTKTVLEYKGSIGIDENLIKAADILENEKVHVLNLNNGERLETYTIKEKAGSGAIVLYGPAAKKGKVGDTLYILSYCIVDDKEAGSVKPKIIKVDRNNRIV